MRKKGGSACSSHTLPRGGSDMTPLYSVCTELNIFFKKIKINYNFVTELLSIFKQVVIFEKLKKKAIKLLLYQIGY